MRKRGAGWVRVIVFVRLHVARCIFVVSVYVYTCVLFVYRHPVARRRSDQSSRRTERRAPAAARAGDARGGENKYENETERNCTAVASPRAIVLARAGVAGLRGRWRGDGGEGTAAVDSYPARRGARARADARRPAAAPQTHIRTMNARRDGSPDESVCRFPRAAAAAALFPAAVYLFARPPGQDVFVTDTFRPTQSRRVPHLTPGRRCRLCRLYHCTRRRVVFDSFSNRNQQSDRKRPFILGRFFRRTMIAETVRVRSRRVLEGGGTRLLAEGAVSIGTNRLSHPRFCRRLSVFRVFAQGRICAVGGFVHAVH